MKRLKSIRLAIRSINADAVVSLGSANNVLMLAALMGVSCRKIISERSDPAHEPISLVWKFLRWCLYRQASLHVTQSRHVTDWSRHLFPSVPCRTIGNATGSEFQIDAAYRGCVDGGNPERPVELLFVGRLTYEKGADILISALVEAQRACSRRVKLVMLGDGPCREMLEREVGRLGLTTDVKFLGKVKNVAQHMLGADIFVLPSRFEGFPNALIEAMAVGTPVIAARCRGGVDDILGSIPERYALEFPPGDVTALAKAISRLASSPSCWREFAAAGRMRAAEYHPDKISVQWDEAVRG